MALYYDLPVFKDVYKLILRIFEYTKDFHKRIQIYFGARLEKRWNKSGKEYLQSQ